MQFGVGMRRMGVDRIEMASFGASTVHSALGSHTLPMTSSTPAFRGNKAALPSKPCVACGRPMSWRRRWARTWDEVKFCSDACRRTKGTRG